MATIRMATIRKVVASVWLCGVGAVLGYLIVEAMR
jgi:hypothetical protein